MKIITTKLSKRLKVSNDTFREVQKYDSDNVYPQNVLMIVSGSGSASSVADIHFRFVKGRGFTQNGDKIVNKQGLTLNELLRFNVKDFSKLNGFAIHLNYNANFKIASAHFVPFEHCRLGLPDDYGYVSKIAVYNNWDKSIKKGIFKNDIDYIDIFNPDPKIIEQQVRNAGSFRKYKGQIFYYSFDGDLTYPMSPFDPVLEDVETDSRIKTFKYKSIVTSFSASHMFVHKGTFASQTERDDFMTELNNFQGDENAGNVFLVEVDGDEDVPEIKDFKVINNDKLFEYTEKSIQDNIRKSRYVPPVLLGDLVTGRLGTAEEILDANILYNAFTEDDREIFETTFSKIFKNFSTPIKSNLKIERLTIMSEESLATRKTIPQVDKKDDTSSNNGG